MLARVISLNKFVPAKASGAAPRLVVGNATAASFITGAAAVQPGGTDSAPTEAPWTRVTGPADPTAPNWANRFLFDSDECGLLSRITDAARAEAQAAVLSAEGTPEITDPPSIGYQSSGQRIIVFAKHELIFSTRYVSGVTTTVARGILHSDLDVSELQDRGPRAAYPLRRRAMIGIDMHLHTVTVVAVSSAVSGTVAP